MRQLSSLTVVNLGVFVFIGCSSSPAEESSPKPFLSDETQSQADGDEADRAASLGCGELTFEDWESWTQINTDALPSEGHGNKWVDIYVDNLAEPTYRSAGSPYGQCAVILKAAYFSADRNLMAGLTAMVKMPAGYDPLNGDWWYGSFDKSGVTTKEEGKLEECIACHQGAVETDYLFSREVLEASAE